MKVYLASASMAEISWAVEHGLADGVTTSPGLLAAERPGAAEGRELLAEIGRAVALPVHASVASVEPGAMYRDGRELAKLSDNIVVQIPLVDDAVVAIRRLTAEGVRVAATLVFSAAQALLAAKAGAVVAVVPFDQLSSFGSATLAVIEEIRALYDRGDVECDVMTAFPRDAAEFTACGLAGADSATLDPETLRQMLVHPLTDRGIDAFLRELSTRPKPRIAPV
jgi:transaldolase